MYHIKIRDNKKRFENDFRLNPYPTNIGYNIYQRNLKRCVNAYCVIAFGGTTVEPVLDVPLSTAATDGGAVNKMNSRDPSELIPAAGAANSLALAPTASATDVYAVPNLGLSTTPKPSLLKNDCLHPFIFLFFFFFYQLFSNPILSFFLTRP